MIKQNHHYVKFYARVVPIILRNSQNELGNSGSGDLFIKKNTKEKENHDQCIDLGG